MPAAVRNEDRVLRVFLVAEEREDGLRPLDVYVLPEQEAAEAAGRLFAVIEGRTPHVGRGLPEEVVFTSRTHFDLLAPVLSVAGVATRYESGTSTFTPFSRSCSR